MKFSGTMVVSCIEQVSSKVQLTISVLLLRSKTEEAPTSFYELWTLCTFGSPVQLYIMDTVYYIEAQVQPKEKYTDAYKKYIMSI